MTTCELAPEPGRFAYVRPYATPGRRGTLPADALHRGVITRVEAPPPGTADDNARVYVRFDDLPDDYPAEQQFYADELDRVTQPRVASAT